MTLPFPSRTVSILGALALAVVIALGQVQITIAQSQAVTVDRQVSPLSVPLEQGEVTVTIALTGDSKACTAVIGGKSADIVLVIDHSSSMSDPIATLLGQQDKLGAAKEAAKTFVQGVDLGVNRIAVVEFDDAADVVLSLSSDRARLNTAIDSIFIGGGTAIDQGIAMAERELASNKRAGANGVIVLLSDGGSDASSATDAANAAKAAGYRLITIGLGSDADHALLQAMASQPGDYYFAPDATQLSQVYTSIAQTVVQPGAASDLTLVHTFDSSNFEVLSDSISPAGTLGPTSITWMLADLPNGTTTLTYRARPRSPGTFNIDLGDTMSFLECQDKSRPQKIDFPAGLPIQVIPPPTPTLTPTPTTTPTPIATPIPTPTPSNIERAQTFVVGAFCGFPWWLLLCCGLLLLFSLLWIIKRVRDELAKPPEKRSPCLCGLIPLLLIPLTILLLGFILSALTNSLCVSRESVYFWRIDGSSAGVFVTSPDGSERARPFAALNAANSCVGCHAVSSTSRRIAAIAGGGVGPVVVFSLDGDRIDVPSVDASYLSWSPDGARLALSTSDADIYILTIADGSLKPLAGASDPSVAEVMPAWGPSGTIAFVRAPTAASPFRIDEPSDIYVVPETGGTATPLTGASGGGFNYYPAYSPDGKWLAFTYHKDGTTTYADPLAEIYLLPAAGGQSKRLSANDAADGTPLTGVSNSWPSWSRDGRYLAFNSKRSAGNFDIYVTEIFPDGRSGPAMPLRSAASSSSFEHLPFWGTPPQVSPWAGLLALWPCLIPFLLVLLAWILCRLLCPKRRVGIPPEWVVRPVRRRPPPLPPLDIETPWQVAPALIVGVGGTGRWVLTHLKKALLDGGLGELPKGVRFVLLDTAQEETTNVFVDATGQPVVSFAGVGLDRSEMLLLQENLADVVSRLANQPQADPVLEGWFPASVYRGLGRQTNLAEGTFGRRPMARAGLIRSLRREAGEEAGLESAGGDRLWALLSQGSCEVLDRNQVRIVLVGSLAGGMSGVLADLAYLAQAATKQATGIKPSVEGYFTTAAAFSLVRGDTLRNRVNTWASLREHARFLLSEGWPYHMRYRAGSQELPDGICDWRLFDDIYLFGGSGKPEISQPEIKKVKSSEPWATVFASMADTIAFRLDRGVIAGWSQIRQKMSAGSDTSQKALGQAVVSGAGSFVYRVPLQDMLEQVKSRWAVELVRESLGIEGGMATPEAIGLPPETAAQKFLSGELPCGEPPRGLIPLGRLASGATLDSRDFLKMTGAAGQQGSRTFGDYLRHTLGLILVGSTQAEGTRPAGGRAGKMDYAVAFLEALDKLLAEAERRADDLSASARPAERTAQTNPALLAKEWRSVVARSLNSLRGQRDLLAGREARGEQSAVEGVYHALRLRAKLAQRCREQMDRVAVRRYLWTRAKDPSKLISDPGNAVDLVTEWYETYADPHILEHLDRLYWEVTPGGDVRLSLVTFGDQTMTLTRDNVPAFTKELMGLADHVVRDVWKNTSLVNLMRDHGLVGNRDRIEPTLSAIWPIASPHLEADQGERNAAAGITAATRRGAPELVTAFDDPRQVLRSALAPTECQVLEQTDKYALTLVRTLDLAPLSRVDELQRARQAYLGALGRKSAEMDPAEQTAVFAAEHNALTYELRLPEIKVQPRHFDPYLVLALEQIDRAKDYALAWAKGWIAMRNNVVTLTLPGGKLQPPYPAVAYSLPPLVVGLLKFCQPADVEQAAALKQALNNLASAEDLQAWRDYFAEWSDAMGTPARFANESQAVQDLAAFAALCVYDRLLEVSE